MDELLTPVSTTYRASPQAQEPFLTEVKRPVSGTSKDHKPAASPVSNLDDAIQVLKSQPEYDELVTVLRFLTGNGDVDESTRHRLAPGPKSAAVIQLIVTDIATNYWPLLAEVSLDGGSEHTEELSGDATMFIRCLRSVTGLNALLAHIKAFTQEIKAHSTEHQRTDLHLNLRLLLDLLAAILAGDHAIRYIWATSLAGCSGDLQVKGQTQSLVAAMTSGRLQATVAEALQHVDQKGLRSDSRWTGDGLEFTRWLGRNVSSWALDLPANHGDLEVLSTLFQRGLSMGYQGE